ncbi:MAG: hypothetical protein ABH827_01130 [bacterium]
MTIKLLLQKLFSQKLACFLAVGAFIFVQQVFAENVFFFPVSGQNLGLDQQDVVKRLVAQSQADDQFNWDLIMGTVSAPSAPAPTQTDPIPAAATVDQSQYVVPAQDQEPYAPVQAPTQAPIDQVQSVMPQAQPVYESGPVQLQPVQTQVVPAQVAPVQVISVAPQTIGTPAPAKAPVKKTVKKVVKKVVRKKARQSPQVQPAQQVNQLQQAKIALQKAQQQVQALEKQKTEQKKKQEDFRVKKQEKRKPGVHWKTAPKKPKKTKRAVRARSKVISRFKKTHRVPKKPGTTKIIENPGANIKQQTEPLVPANVPTQVNYPGSIPTA